MTNPDKVAKNIIPRGFTIECDIRPLPDQDPADLIDIIRSNIEDRINKIKTTVPDEKFYVHVGPKRAFAYPMETSRDSFIIKAVEEIAGHPAETVSFNTEGSIFNKAGSETVIWGPTDIRQAHTDNEYVFAELFKEETIEKYIRLIRRVCSEGGD
jgi:acetylornithine deacetylase